MQFLNVVIDRFRNGNGIEWINDKHDDDDTINYKQCINLRLYLFCQSLIEDDLFK